MDRAKVFVIIKRFMQSRVPGYFEVLEAQCRKMFGKGCVDLLLDEPDKLRAVLMNKYGGDVTSTYFAVKHLFLRPLLMEVNKLDVEEELATCLLNNPQKFKEKLKQVL
ncbi:MAG: hypothetical protein LM572_07170 [Ignisphaera sp.]|nr:hypothetical protein [Ignisphaera sp.]